jgi:hypothetical protein
MSPALALTVTDSAWVGAPRLSLRLFNLVSHRDRASDGGPPPRPRLPSRRGRRGRWSPGLPSQRDRRSPGRVGARSLGPARGRSAGGPCHWHWQTGHWRALPGGPGSRRPRIMIRSVFNDPDAAGPLYSDHVQILPGPGPRAAVPTVLRDGR